LGGIREQEANIRNSEIWALVLRGGGDREKGPVNVTTNKYKAITLRGTRLNSNQLKLGRLRKKKGIPKRKQKARGKEDKKAVEPRQE